jgi:hypothetical protein
VKPASGKSDSVASLSGTGLRGKLCSQPDYDRKMMGSQKRRNRSNTAGSRDVLRRLGRRLQRLAEAYSIGLALIGSAGYWLVLYLMGGLDPFSSTWLRAGAAIMGLLQLAALAPYAGMALFLAAVICGFALAWAAGYLVVRPLLDYYIRHHYRQAWEYLVETNLALAIMDETLMHRALDPLYDGTVSKWSLPTWPRTLAQQLRIGVRFREALVAAGEGKPPASEDLHTGLFRLRGCDCQACAVSFAIMCVLSVVVMVLPIGGFVVPLLALLLVMLNAFSLRLIASSWEAAICHCLLDEPDGRWLNGWAVPMDYVRGQLRRS